MGRGRQAVVRAIHDDDNISMMTVMMVMRMVIDGDGDSHVDDDYVDDHGDDDLDDLDSDDDDDLDDKDDFDGVGTVENRLCLLMMMIYIRS